VTAPTLQQWDRLKRLTPIVDQQVDQRKIKAVGLTDPDDNDMSFITPGVEHPCTGVG